MPTKKVKRIETPQRVVLDKLIEQLLLPEGGTVLAEQWAATYDPPYVANIIDGKDDKMTAYLVTLDHTETFQIHVSVEAESAATAREAALQVAYDEYNMPEAMRQQPEVVKWDMNAPYHVEFTVSDICEED